MKVTSTRVRIIGGDGIYAIVPSPKKQTKNVREKPNEKNDKYNITNRCPIKRTML